MMLDYIYDAPGVIGQILIYVVLVNTAQLLLGSLWAVHTWLFRA